MNVSILLALVGMILAALPEARATESGNSLRDEKDASARGGKPLRDDAEDARRGLGGWGGSKDTDSPTMFPTLHPTISPTISPTLFPTISPTFCGKAGKASGDYYYSGSRRNLRAKSRRLQGTPVLRNSKSSKSGDYYYSGKAESSDCLQGPRDASKSSKSGSSKSSKSDRAVDGVAAAGAAVPGVPGATRFKLFPGGSRRLVRGGDAEAESWRPKGDSESERAEPAAGFEPDSVRRRRINRAD